MSFTAVRNGDLKQFGRVLDEYGTKFQAEKTYTLIVRLRHNVIKTGIRMISLSYSRSGRGREGREGGRKQSSLSGRPLIWIEV